MLTEGPLTLDLTPGVRLSVAEAQARIPLGVPLATRIGPERKALLVNHLPAGTILDYTMPENPSVKRCEVQATGTKNLIQTDKMDWWMGNQPNATITIISFPTPPSVGKWPAKVTPGRLTVAEASAQFPEGTAWFSRPDNGDKGNVLATLLPVGTVVFYTSDPRKPLVVCDGLDNNMTDGMDGTDLCSSLYILSYPKNPVTFRCFGSPRLTDFTVTGPTDPAADRTAFPIEIPMDLIDQNIPLVRGARRAAMVRYAEDRTRYINDPTMGLGQWKLEQTWKQFDQLRDQYASDVRAAVEAKRQQAIIERDIQAQKERERKEREAFDVPTRGGVVVDLCDDVYIVTTAHSAVFLTSLTNGGWWSRGVPMSSKPTLRDVIGVYGMGKNPRILTRQEALALLAKR
jgi:hypothetical protein